jgi:hypothetical protein
MVRALIGNTTTSGSGGPGGQARIYHPATMMTASGQPLMAAHGPITMAAHTQVSDLRETSAVAVLSVKGWSVGDQHPGGDEHLDSGDDTADRAECAADRFAC